MGLQAGVWLLAAALAVALALPAHAQICYCDDGLVCTDCVTLGTETTGGYAGSASEAGPATTALALNTNPTDCGANTYANTIAANGNLTCTTVTLGADTTGGYAASVSEAGPATTATALAANGTNCSANFFARGVDASGNAENCTPDIGGYYQTIQDESSDLLQRGTLNFLGTSVTCADAFVSTNCTFTDDDVPEAGDFGALVLAGDIGSSGLTTTIGADKVRESMLKVVNSTTDEYCLTSETTTGDFEWQPCTTTSGRVLHIPIPGPDDVDNFILGKLPVAATITDIHCITTPASTTTIIQVQERTSSGASPGSTGGSITCTSSGATDVCTGGDDCAWDANDWFGVDIGASNAAAVTISIFYTTP